MQTLDQLKEKISRIDDITILLKELDNCPDPLTKLCRVTYNDGTLNTVHYLTERILKKVISIGMQQYKQELSNELTTLMDEIQCTNTTSVECQLP